jgi:uncharacterized OB-fold protein
VAEVKIKSEPHRLEGSPLAAGEFDERKTILTEYTPKLRYAWDTGEAMSRYLQELKEGRLIARYCCKCTRVMIPPRMFCERCFRPADDWVYVRDTGTVNTFSLCYVSWDVRRLKTPEIPAVIEIDGASPGMGILHLIRNIKPEDVRVGMRVAAVWKPAAERTGSITDIDFWQPIASRRG